jgi:hypothetical protein
MPITKHEHRTIKSGDHTQPSSRSSARPNARAARATTVSPSPARTSRRGGWGIHGACSVANDHHGVRGIAARATTPPGFGALVSGPDRGIAGAGGAELLEAVADQPADLQQFRDLIRHRSASRPHAITSALPVPLPCPSLPPVKNPEVAAWLRVLQVDGLDAYNLWSRVVVLRPPALRRVAASRPNGTASWVVFQALPRMNIFRRGRTSFRSGARYNASWRIVLRIVFQALPRMNTAHCRGRTSLRPGARSDVAWRVVLQGMWCPSIVVHWRGGLRISGVWNGQTADECQSNRKFFHGNLLGK